MAQSVLGFWNNEVGDKHKGKNKAVKFPFDAMGKGIERVSKERRYCRHDHIKNIVVWVDDREVYRKQEGSEESMTWRGLSHQMISTSNCAYLNNYNGWPNRTDCCNKFMTNIIQSLYENPKLNPSNLKAWKNKCCNKPHTALKHTGLIIKQYVIPGRRVLVFICCHTFEKENHAQYSCLWEFSVTLKYLS